jgi:large subunit ribosomal protein L33
MEGPSPRAIDRRPASARPVCKEFGQMASDKRVHVTLECTECKRRNYITNKSKVNDRERIEMKKYCKWDRRHTLHKETR